jgi:hypothetical protein
MADLSRDEFLVHIGYVLKAVEETKEQVSIQNGRTRLLESKVAVLESQVESASQTGSDRTARMTGLSGVLASAGALLWQWFKG